MGRNDTALSALKVASASAVFDSPTLRLLRDDHLGALRIDPGQIIAGTIGPSLASVSASLGGLEASRTAAVFGDDIRSALGIASIANASTAIEVAAAHAINGPLGTMATASRWADKLLQPEPIESLLHVARGSLLSPSIGALSAAATAFVNGTDPTWRRSLLDSLGATSSAVHSLDQTSLKLAVFAGASDILGPRSSLLDAARESILGSWATSPQLPDRFWTDTATRIRMYRDAGVDEALAEAPAAAALEVLIDSGVIVGARADGGGSIALIGFGGVTASIKSQHARTGAFRILDAFEERLRDFIEDMLEPLEGAAWFKRRVPGDILGEARLKQKTAVAKGETRERLINYTDLGHLIDIVTYGKNWNEVFEQVFGNRDEFRVDMGRLVASRRPTAHVRTVDGVRLTEIVMIAHRLGNLMDHWNDLPAFDPEA